MNSQFSPKRALFSKRALCPQNFEKKKKTPGERSGFKTGAVVKCSQKNDPDSWENPNFLQNFLWT